MKETIIDFREKLWWCELEVYRIWETHSYDSNLHAVCMFTQLDLLLVYGLSVIHYSVAILWGPSLQLFVL